MDKNNLFSSFNGHDAPYSLQKVRHIQRKRSVRRVIAGLLAAVLCMGVLADVPLPDSICPVVVQAKGTDYSQYSNTKKSWYVKRNKDHQPSEGAASAKSLANYQAYYYDDQTKENVLYLTFDCGYENGYTPKLLDTLKKHDAKAIFFVTKHFVQSQPELCKRMKEEGHLVGNHTMNHPSLPDQSVTQIQEEIRGLETVFKEKTGYELDKFFRPPMGEFSDRVLKVVQDLGYRTIFWSIVYYDYNPDQQPGKQYVMDHFNQYDHRGAIALMHNISKSNAEALDGVLTELEKKGYRVARIDEIGQLTDLHVAAVEWEEYLFCDGKISPTCIELRFFTDMNKKDLKPEGFEIYRKEKGGQYQLIATKKATKNSSYTYRDRDVKTGKTYYYKVKAYRYMYGRKYVTSVAASMKKTAVNQTGKYTVTCKNQGLESTEELVLKVTSDKTNGSSVFTSEIYSDIPVWRDGGNEVELDLYAYSFDNVTWHKLNKKRSAATLKPGKTIYLKYRTYDGQTVSTLSDGRQYRLESLSLKYNGFYYAADINLKSKKGTAKIVGEYYH
ncbi:MAG: polysaccharide deacetylase family protein [Lachnospiraceae bacterium]|nr:polysaccharide deacetylase family protein [bacterium]MDY5518318.1 polysaccharide deacetylase family protein [Lachnospiraceae bacterium]